MHDTRTTRFSGFEFIPELLPRPASGPVFLSPDDACCSFDLFRRVPSDRVA